MSNVDGLIEIKSERCSRCGTCIEVCPADILEMGREAVENAYPERCISCGHCAAICPVDAITSKDTNNRTPFTIEGIPEGLPPEQVLFLRKRSTRKFKEEKLDKETIESMVQYAEQAPSSHNLRQREYIVVTDPEKIRQMEEIVVKVYRSLLRILKPPVIKLIGLFSKPMAHATAAFAVDFKHMVEKADRGESHIFRGAPCVVFILGSKNYDQSRDDCVAAQNYMMLYGQSLGIGSCIIGYAQYAHKKLEKYLEVPADKKIYAVTIFGYPVYKYKKTIRYKIPAIAWKTNTDGSN